MRCKYVALVANDNYDDGDDDNDGDNDDNDHFVAIYDLNSWWEKSKFGFSFSSTWNEGVRVERKKNWKKILSIFFKGVPIIFAFDESISKNNIGFNWN